MERARARRRRAVRRRRIVALCTLALIVALIVGVSATGLSDFAGVPPRVVHRRPPLPADTAVGVRILTFVDRTRTIHFLNGTSGPRTFVTEIRYPAHGRSGANDVSDAPPQRGAGPYPLVIFGHGFGITPAQYATLLDAWARAGYVVAAPVFQLGVLSAPGGPNEADLINWPADMRFVISRMLAAGARADGPFSRLIDAQRIAVTGQSDGGDTALALAFDPAERDPRVKAAVILSGAEIPELGPFTFPSKGPPLLATQGTNDTINLPTATTMFFVLAPRPKFLLTLEGAEHLPPYETAQPDLGIVERVTIAFLNRYLKGKPAELRQMTKAGDVPGISALQADLRSRRG